jgi:dipeptidyl aminopeptidase/acylaminoacyl peptidase
MTSRIALLFAWLVIAVPVAAAAAAAAAPTTTRPVSFVRDVGPILLQQCQTCHDARKSKGDYRLDSFDAMMTAGAGKKAPIVAGKAAQGELFRRLTTPDEDDRMPQKADPLPPAQVALIERWIDEGAAFDGADRRAPLASQVSASAGEARTAPQVYPRPIPITALAFSPDGKTIAAAGYHEVTLWGTAGGGGGAAGGKLVGRIPGLPQRIYGIDFSPDGARLAVAGGAPGVSGEVRLCDVARREAGPPLDRIADCMLVARFSPDGKTLAAGGADNAVRLYDVATGRRTHLIEQHADWVVDLAFAPDGASLATASRDKSARLFGVRDGAMRGAFLSHGQPLTAVAFDPGGSAVVSVARGDNRIRIWSATGEMKELTTIANKDADVTRMLALPPGVILTAAADGSLRQYFVATKALAQTFPGGDQPVYSLAYNPKTRQIATGDHAGAVRVYDLKRGEKIGEFVAAPGYRQR